MTKNLLTLLLLISCGGSSSPSTNNTRSSNPKKDTGKKENIVKVSVNGNDIVNAIEKGNLDIIKKLLKDIDDINDSKKITSRENWSFIHLAAINNRNDILKLLLAKGAKVDEIINVYNIKNSDYEYMTALMIASKKGYLDIVKTLIAANADVNIRLKIPAYYTDNSDIKYKTALHFAAINGHKEIVEALVEAEADKTTTDAEGKKAIDYAENPEIKELLREKTVDIFTAAANGDIDGVKEYIKSIEDINAKREYKNKTALQYAVENGHEEVVRELLNAGATINKESIHSDKSVTAAVEIGSVPILELLLKDIDNIDNAENVIFKGKGMTYTRNWPLIHLAAHHNKKEVVEFLLSKGAKVDKLIEYNLYINQNSYNYKNITALMIASKEGYLDIVEILLEAGANVNIEVKDTDVYREYNGYTALHFAAENGHLQIVEELLEKQADVDKINYFDDTPSTFAIRNGHLEIAKLLINKSNIINNSLLITSLSSIKNSEIVLSFIDFLLTKDAIKNNINKIGDRGFAPIHIAAQKTNSEDILKKLIEAGADINILSNHSTYKNYTALHFAVSRDTIEADEVVELLKGSDNLDKQTEDGFTPLNLAYGKKGMIEALLKAGADIDFVNMSGKKAIDSYKDSKEDLEIKEIFDRYKK